MTVQRRVNNCGQNGIQVKSDLITIQKLERDQLLFWRSPFLTLYYFFMECVFRFAQLRFAVYRNKNKCVVAAFIVFVLVFLDYSDGPHSKVFDHIKSTALWWSWWVWLGFLSSCGFGTGLHTFVLYLGPFIAEVTMSAYECGTLNFPRPPYPDRIICPDNPDLGESINFWKVMRKVQMESIMVLVLHWVNCLHTSWLEVLDFPVNMMMSFLSWKKSSHPIKILKVQQTNRLLFKGELNYSYII
uniref:Uncharacterized protein n=1 Tax=Trichobilharzia regenti TaxID=157069 RepID=A0AA85ILS6_TRIRE|nr:unnamed protein product [Trichobilharzia regenti]